MGRFIVDVLDERGAVEIQTGSFSRLKRKLPALLEALPVRLVYPVCARKWLVHFDEGSREQRRRRSPRRQGLEAAFAELVAIAGVIGHPRLAIEVLLTEQEEVRVSDSRRRRGWRVIERRLLEVLDRHVVHTSVDLLGLLPGRVPQTFTTRELVEAFGSDMRTMQRACYCLRHAGVIEAFDKRGNAPVYRLA